ncbi:hypothetical protein L8R80_13780 [Vibrio splendidus]|uniref:hypothetical protein n=1 Tax=Vibrio splendidus TaxID=29497 RepID=UPI0024699F60|nr:hypothetical protein [Vibrio splendidus]MDH5911479.1 hypothetical protein [Vibrio splendidus]MDH5942736.1 hypothetical protein [Vibrio splendidus]MDH5985717.1 hypothetical protein [Vibrio splendidus]MDH5994313.1 hypothetical protein [Vibrio splendidus]MDH6005144.1 hypothetical protein [Vibrio splendidus]
MKNRPNSWWMIIALIISNVTGVAQAESISQPETNSAVAPKSAMELEHHYSRLSQDHNVDLESRIAATVELGNFNGKNALIAIARASRDSEPEMRIAAIRAVQYWSPVARWDVVSPLLNDNNGTVKIQAIRSVSTLRSAMNHDQQAYLDRKIVEYLENTQDKPSFERTEIYISQANYLQASEELARLENTEQLGHRSTLLHSEILVRQAKLDEAEAFINQRGEQQPLVASLHFQLGIIKAKQNNYLDAELQFKHASELEPTNHRYLYTLASITQKNHPEDAYPLFYSLYEMSGKPHYLYAACELLISNEQDAKSCLEELSQFTKQDTNETQPNVQS